MSERPVQDTKDFTRLFEEGQASPPFLDESGKKIAEAMRDQFPDLLGDVEFTQGPVKTLERSAAKLSHESKPILDPGKAENIVDLARGRIVIDTPDQIRAIREFLKPENLKTLGIEYVKDRFAKPSDTHYRDINLNVRLENGHIAEIQINQRDLLAASEFTHDSYEDIDAIKKRAALENRDLSKAEEIDVEKLKDYTRDTHDYGAAKVPGIDELLSDEGRAKLERDFSARLLHDPDFKPGVTIEAGTKYGVPFVQRAEAYGGEGYKALAMEYGTAPNRLEIDPGEIAKLDPPTMLWDRASNNLEIQNLDRFNDMMARQGISLERYSDLGATVTLKTPGTPDKILTKAAATLGELGRNGGVVSGVVFGSLSSLFAMAAGSSKTEAAEMFYGAAVPYGETQIDMAQGDLTAAQRSATIETASNGGSLGGAFVGGSFGTAFFPGPGTVIGAGIGALGGGIGTGYITEKIYDNFEAIKSGALRVSEEAIDAFGSAMLETKTMIGEVWDEITEGEKPAIDMQSTYEHLPDIPVPGMPPEVESLSKSKGQENCLKRLSWK